MKIGVLSDTHLQRMTGELEKICERYFFDKDLILHAGDVVSVDVVDFFRGMNFVGVHGNMDPVQVQEQLPGKKTIKLGDYRIGLIHGWGSSEGLEDRIRPEFEAVDVIVYGHSHRAANQMQDGVLFFNPGTATGFSHDGTHTIGVLELGDLIRGEIITL